MNPVKFLQNMTAEDVQRYVRIGLQWLAAFLVTHGMKQEASWVEPLSGLVVGLITLAWTMYGNRLTAKVAEITKYADDPKSPVQGVVMAATPEGKAIANSIDSSSVAAAGTPNASAIAKP